MESHATSKMIGSPPGYIGYEAGRQLTESVRHRPYSVVLFDEIEKAHPEVFNMLLQILEDGRLTDAKGRVASFKNTIVIMTSNVGSQFIAEMGPLGFISEETKNDNRRESAREKVMTALREQFRPEFLNRVDEVIIFDYLGTEEIKKIFELEIAKVARRMATQRIELEVTGKAKELLAERGFDQNLGARPLKRVIQKSLLNPLALKIVSGEIGPGGKIIIGVEKGEIDIQQALAMPSLKRESATQSGAK
jgi:ATP-dependent Clp protease ATP-binding subunit ClpA